MTKPTGAMKLPEPCPLCASADVSRFDPCAFVGEEWQVVCQECGCRASESAWNRRAQAVRTEAVEVTELQELVKTWRQRADASVDEGCLLETGRISMLRACANDLDAALAKQPRSAP